MFFALSGIPPKGGTGDFNFSKKKIIAWCITTVIIIPIFIHFLSETRFYETEKMMSGVVLSKQSKTCFAFNANEWDYEKRFFDYEKRFLIVKFDSVPKEFPFLVTHEVYSSYNIRDRVTFSVTNADIYSKIFPKIFRWYVVLKIIEIILLAFYPAFALLFLVYLIITWRW